MSVDFPLYYLPQLPEAPANLVNKYVIIEYFRQW